MAGEATAAEFTGGLIYLPGRTRGDQRLSTVALVLLIELCHRGNEDEEGWTRATGPDLIDMLPHATPTQRGRAVHDLLALGYIEHDRKFVRVVYDRR